MEDISLVRLERIARNLIHSDLQMERIPSENGEIYFAHGLNAEGIPVGVWGCRDMARHLEFKDDTSLEQIRQMLVNDAAGFIESCVDREFL